ncbi:hypothetical protein TRV_07567 [Trichophyton verrucosum HKI 0517]|uniref:Nucleotidyltransferase n=1 Tax=Trichophyton verrucosum (strain HKI 0517) TaxID=663202 RepID=D4DK46_TRIVH|nr:uncharacterized protein TRV_07567 [Trichophyton verrucosum HKI 0517]EFE37768.1 hypothetical protein TRV_07567 [Trichophyton verrucosum HKI 0517]
MERQTLTIEEMQKGLVELDRAMGENEMIYAFSPITVISPGGFLAVSYLKSRETTEDIDIIIDPQWTGDKDIIPALRELFSSVGKKLGLNRKWLNDDVSLFLTQKAREQIFNAAGNQNIILYEGPNLRVLGAPLEWGLESKLRRINSKPDHPKVPTDIQDILIILKLLIERNNGPLNRRQVRERNTNGFDILPSEETLDLVANAYQNKYGEYPFC